MTPTVIPESVSAEIASMRWRTWLITQRIRELNDAKMCAFTIDGIFYGSPQSVRDLIAGAISSLECGEFDAAEVYCERAEREIIRQRGPQGGQGAEQGAGATPLSGNPAQRASDTLRPAEPTPGKGGSP
jgi:hypothetical protein